MFKTPCYIFNTDLLQTKIRQIQRALPGIPLTYSIKANPFLVGAIAEDICHVEVCSPGELAICKRIGINPKQIIYSGVMKESWDIAEAIDYDVDILTAESPRHIEMIQEEAARENRKVKVLVRLSSGNQFGMSKEDLFRVIEKRNNLENIELIGIHYYSGTQKTKEKQIEKDIAQMLEVLTCCKEYYDFIPELVEFGPGMAVDYFGDNCELEDKKTLERLGPLIREFAQSFPVGIEMGRYITADCGRYLTSVKDLKTTEGVTYAILDGGIHHLNYYGQVMAMKRPPITQEPVRSGKMQHYCLCGSLCTVADVLVREIELKPLNIGDVLTFGRCGAYSVTEAPALFLSRKLPSVYLESGVSGMRLVRDCMGTDALNSKHL